MYAVHVAGVATAHHTLPATWRGEQGDIMCAAIAGVTFPASKGANSRQTPALAGHVECVVFGFTIYGKAFFFFVFSL